MPSYSGRINNDAEIYNFLGLNVKSSIVDGGPGEAIEIDNWDVDLSGAITRRLGYVTQSTFGANLNHFDTFFKLDGTQVYIAVSGGNLWEALSPAGPWTNRGGTLSTGDFTYIGTDLNGAYVLCNGVDKPIVFIPGSAVQNLEDASILIVPTNVAVSSVGGSGVAYQYVVTAATPRGETTASVPGTTLNGPATLTVNTYNTISWTPPTGAFVQYVYRYNSTFNSFYRIATLTGTADSFVDNGATEDIFSMPPTTNGAYNTPEDWNTNGQPEGVFIVARGKNQRILAWRKSYYWLSALSNIYDWYTLNDSFSGFNLGGQDNNITAITTLYDYTVMFSRTNAFIYTGSSYADWSLSKITNTGCPSHYSIIFMGDQGILWSQFGPTTLDRILSGQDVQTTTVGKKISPIVFDETNVNEWRKIRSWHDIKRQRVCFAVPGDGETVNTMVLAYNYQTKAWTQFSGWSIENIAYDPVAQLNYATLDGLNVVLLHSGNTDGGVRVDNVYKTTYENSRSWLRKRNVFLDVLMDPANPYEVDVTVDTDFEDETIPVQTYHLSFDGTTAKTDNESVVGEGKNRILVDIILRWSGPNLKDQAMGRSVLGRAGSRGNARNKLIPLLLGKPLDRISRTHGRLGHTLEVSREGILDRSSHKGNAIQALLPLPPLPAVDVYCAVVQRVQGHDSRLVGGSDEGRGFRKATLPLNSLDQR